MWFAGLKAFAQRAVDKANFPRASKRYRSRSPPPQRYVGIIKRLDDGKHFCFIECGQLLQDPYAKGDELEGFENGNKVEFSITASHSGLLHPTLEGSEL